MFYSPTYTRQTARPTRSLAVLFILTLFLSFGLAEPAHAQGTSTHEEESFVYSVGEFLFGLAWPTATYEKVRFGGARAVRGGQDIWMTLYGTSAFSGGELWVELVLEVRNGRIYDLRWGRHNGILAAPGETVAFLAEDLAEELAKLTREYERSQRGTASASPPRTASGQFRVRNRCAKPVEILIYYEDDAAGWLWATWSFAGGEDSRLLLDGAPLSSSNGTWYWYAVSTDATMMWSGDHDATVQGQKVPMRRARAAQGQGHITVLTCD